MTTTFRDAVEHTEERRSDFFKLIFGNAQGFVCIAFKPHTERTMEEEYFHYPSELAQMCKRIDQKAGTLTHLYFCPNLLHTRKRNKSNVSLCTVIWSDLDTCNPQLMQVPPSIVVQTSNKRWQALWRLESPIAPIEAEAISRRIAYYHADQGADKSGWDLGQLLRVPYTPNYKYGDINTAPLVVVDGVTSGLYRPSDFNIYPEVEALRFAADPIPVDLPKEDPVDILQRYRQTLNPQAFDLYTSTPTQNQDWSARMWKLQKLCVEAGMSPDEIFVICKAAKCNKYIRDGRPNEQLWTEVLRACIKNVEVHNLAPTATSSIPEFLTRDEMSLVQEQETFVERYIRWASELTDAPKQYHQAGAFIILSSLLCGNCHLPTSFGTINPNLWFMLLADTTITRKTTAMNIAMKLLYSVDEEAMIATDGSVEGILAGLIDRTRRPSVLLRDEFSGLLEAMARKDYLAGMMESLTKLYDGEDVKRLLRKETIHIKSPRFILFAGGPKTKTQSILTEEHISSGFIPRFIVITADADPSLIKDVGPPRPVDYESRELIMNELHDLCGHYTRPRPAIMANGEALGTIRPEFEANLTPEAWRRYNHFERSLTKTALDSELFHLTPVYDRLAKSTLKAAILIAASRQRGEGITVELSDLLHAMYYCRFWYIYVSEIVNGIGKTTDEKLIDQIMNVIHRSKEAGVSRAELMRLFRLDARRADLIFTTMIQRRLVYPIMYQGRARYVEVT